MKESLNIAIVGHGYVGKAVDYGFSTQNVNKFIVDPIYNTDTTELNEVRIDVAFVCVPTPMGADGSIDSSIVRQVVKELEVKSCPIVIKSTITPAVVSELQSDNEYVIYNPEFLTEKNALDDFINPPMHVFGGLKKYTEQIEQILSLIHI